MSVSEMNLSWSTGSVQRSQKSTLRSSTMYLTSSKKQGSNVIKRPQCVSAKNSGMRFQGFREPKPLRSRCGSAGPSEPDLDKPASPRKSSTCKSTGNTSLRGTGNTSARGTGNTSARDETESRDRIARLSQPTMSSVWKTTKGRAREALTDMNWYSWSKMNVYKEHQGVLYGSNGAMKQTVRVKDR